MNCLLSDTKIGNIFAKGISLPNYVFTYSLYVYIQLGMVQLIPNDIAFVFAFAKGMNRASSIKRLMQVYGDA